MSSFLIDAKIDDDRNAHTPIHHQPSTINHLGYDRYKAPLQYPLTLKSETMSTSIPPTSKIKIRPVQFRDLEAIAYWLETFHPEERNAAQSALYRRVQQLRRCYGLLQLLKLFPNPLDNYCSIFVAYQDEHLQGLIQVAPYNKTRSTWRVEQVLVNGNNVTQELLIGHQGIGSQLLRYCFEKIWEARTWVLEVNINEKDTLGLYRQNGFQPLAQTTYWSCSPEILQQLAEKEPDLPNLLPVSNADATLLYQLDCVSMPPLLRQVFDRHIEDFKTGLITYIVEQIQQWLNKTEVVSGYVFEPQRKAAIGYFQLQLCQDGSHPHQAKLTVHPAYTWLYPKLLSQMSGIIQRVPPQSLQLSSADYQPEREEYLEKLGAQRVEHALLMSRSVWHKLRESKPLEALNLPEVLQGLKPARTPIPNPWLKSVLEQSKKDSSHQHRPNSSSRTKNLQEQNHQD